MTRAFAIVLAVLASLYLAGCAWAAADTHGASLIFAALVSGELYIGSWILWKDDA